MGGWLESNIRIHDKVIGGQAGTVTLNHLQIGVFHVSGEQL